MSLNGTTITQATKLYNYRSLLKTLLLMAMMQLAHISKNAMWILDDGNLTACGPTAADSTNKGSMTRWSLTKKSQEIELYGRIHRMFAMCLYIYYHAPDYRSNSQRPSRVFI